MEVTLAEVFKLKKDHLVEVKALPNPPRACITVLGGMVVMLADYIKDAGGEIIMRNIEGSFGKKEEDFFATAKKYFLNDPKELLETLLNYKKETINQKLILMLE